MFSNVHILFCGIAVFTMPFCVDMYSAFVVTAIIFGFSSSYVILKTIVLVELLGEIYSLVKKDTQPYYSAAHKKRTSYNKTLCK